MQYPLTGPLTDLGGPITLTFCAFTVVLSCQVDFMFTKTHLCDFAGFNVNGWVDVLLPSPLHTLTLLVQ